MDLVIGRGEIGRALYYYLRQFGEVENWGHEGIPDKDYTFAYICTGITKTKECEERPLEAYGVNVENTIDLCERFPKGVWISSERVFDGSKPFRDKRDSRSPTTEYGRQKVIAENFLLGEGYGVIRFSKVIGWDVPLFEGWINDIRQGKEIHPFSNMSMAPVSLEYACEVLRKIRGMRGLYQLSGDEDIPYDRIAKHICNYMGRDTDLVQPVESDRPHPHTTLISDFDRPDSWEVINEWCRKRLIE